MTSASFCQTLQIYEALAVHPAHKKKKKNLCQGVMFADISVFTFVNVIKVDLCLQLCKVLGFKERVTPHSFFMNLPLCFQTGYY